VITSAYDSQYGHPDRVVLERLAERELPTYWTATHGTTVLKSNGTAITVQTQRAAPTEPLALREGAAIEPGAGGAVQPRATIRGGTVSTLVVADGGTPTGTSTPTDELVLDRINADAEGDDRTNLNDEYVVLRNTGDTTLDLSGWQLSDAAGATYTIPAGVTLEPGATLTIHTGSGTNTENDLYWDAGSPVWNNDGDTVNITNSDGTEVLSQNYS
jgi:competence protein ComEC